MAMKLSQKLGIVGLLFVLGGICAFGYFIGSGDFKAGGLFVLLSSLGSWLFNRDSGRSVGTDKERHQQSVNAQREVAERSEKLEQRLDSLQDRGKRLEDIASASKSVTERLQESIRRVESKNKGIGDN